MVRTTWWLEEADSDSQARRNCRRVRRLHIPAGREETEVEQRHLALGAGKPHRRNRLHMGQYEGPTKPGNNSIFWKCPIVIQLHSFSLFSQKVSE